MGFSQGEVSKTVQYTFSIVSFYGSWTAAGTIHSFETIHGYVTMRQY